MTTTAMRAVCAAAVFGLSAGAARADFIPPDTYGWSRGAERSTYFEWDIFVDPDGGNVPDVDQFPDPLPSGWVDPDVVVTSGSAVVTGSGRIYSPVGAINLQVTTPNYGEGATTTLLLQVRTIGTELDYAAVMAEGQLPVEIVEISRQSGSMGFEVETLFQFELSGNQDAYVFDVPTVEAHCSIDGIAVDTLAGGDACVADFNGDGAVNTQDFLAYLGAWSAAYQSGNYDAAVDCNGDNLINTQDFLCFLGLWSAGC